MPFRPPTETFKGDEIYDYPQEDGTPNHFHPSCFAQTSQGSAGFVPKKRYIYGEIREVSPDIITKRFNTVM